MPGKQKPMKKCPVCGSKKILPVETGKQMKIDDGAINSIPKQAGDSSFYAPRWFCHNCGNAVGTPPYIRTSRGLEDYRDNVSHICIREEGIYPNYGEIRLTQKDLGAELELIGDKQHPSVYLRKNIPEKKWRDLLDRMFREFYLHEWRQNPLEPHSPADEMWELELVMTHGRRIYCYGWATRPPYWKELVRLFKSYFV